HNRTNDRTRAAGERRSADDGRGDHVEFLSWPARRIAATLKGEQHDCRDSDNKPHQRHDHDPITIDPDTGIVRSLAIAPDGLDAAAEWSVVKQEPAEDGDGEHGPDAHPDTEETRAHDAEKPGCL